MLSLCITAWFARAGYHLILIFYIFFKRSSLWDNHNIDPWSSESSEEEDEIGSGKGSRGSVRLNKRVSTVPTAPIDVTASTRAEENEEIEIAASGSPGASQQPGSRESFAPGRVGRSNRKRTTIPLPRLKDIKDEMIMFRLEAGTEHG